MIHMNLQAGCSTLQKVPYSVASIVLLRHERKKMLVRQAILEGGGKGTEEGRIVASINCNALYF